MPIRVICTCNEFYKTDLMLQQVHPQIASSETRRIGMHGQVEDVLRRAELVKQGTTSSFIVDLLEVVEDYAQLSSLSCRLLLLLDRLFMSSSLRRCKLRDRSLAASRISCVCSGVSWRCGACVCSWRIRPCVPRTIRRSWRDVVALSLSRRTRNRRTAYPRWEAALAWRCPDKLRLELGSLVCGAVNLNCPEYS